MNKKLALLILDGLGIAPKNEGNAVELADTPFMDYLFEKHPYTKLNASGNFVGLQKGQMGDSNVGHLNIGAGRIVWQMLPRINTAIKEGMLETNQVIKIAIDDSIARCRPLHLMGLVSDGGVHSHMSIIKNFLELMSKYEGLQVAIHAILDGRDVPPKSAEKYIDQLESWCREYPFAKIATVSGRYYTMDRDNRWDRTELAFNAMSVGEGPAYASANAVIVNSYENKINDEFVIPSVITDNNQPRALLKEDDQLLFFNFRADRARQISELLVRKGINVTGMTQYDENLDIPVIMAPNEVKNTLAEWLSIHGYSQLHVAETEKYAHVTFFFNGGLEQPFNNEERILVNSPKIATYDLQPEMSAYEITERTIDAISKKNYDFIVLNYANCDMVGHTGNLQAAIKAVEAVDDNLHRLVPALVAKDYYVLITADHGNAEQMIANNSPHTAHTLNKVPFALIGKENCKLKKNGKLGDIAPTILELMNIKKPKEMTGNSLLNKEIKDDTNL